MITTTIAYTRTEAWLKILCIMKSFVPQEPADVIKALKWVLMTVAASCNHSWPC
jgi:hypothetical protein